MAFEHVDWRKLMQAIDRGICVPFIGAGACGNHFPLARELAEALAEDDEFPITGSHCDLSAVAQYMAVRHADENYPRTEIANLFGFRQPRNDMKPKLRRLYEERKDLDPADDSDPHAVLADLKSPVYLTTNYDNFMFKAISDRANKNGVKVTRRDFCRWSDKLFNSLDPRDRRHKYVSPFDAGYQPTGAEPIVYHLHGHADVPDSIVVSEDDYTDFIVDTSAELIIGKGGKSKRERVPGAIREALSNGQLLFIGYRLADQNLHVLLRMVTQRLDIRRLNLAIQLSPSLGDADPQLIPQILKYLEDRYEWSLKLQVYWGDAREFATELRKRMNERNRAVTVGGNAA